MVDGMEVAKFVSKYDVQFDEYNWMIFRRNIIESVNV